MVNLSELPAAVKLNHSHLRSVDLLNKYNFLGNNICYFVWKLTSNLISIIWQYPSIRYLCSGVSTWAEIVCCRTIFTTWFFSLFHKIKGSLQENITITFICTDRQTFMKWKGFSDLLGERIFLCWDGSHWLMSTSYLQGKWKSWKHWVVDKKSISYK